MLTEELIRSHLYGLKHPGSEVPLISPQMISSIVISNKKVHIALRLGYPAKIYQKVLQAHLHSALSALPGIEEVTIDLTWRVNPHTVQKNTKIVPKIKNIIAVASGKGGVGKSTTALNLALAILAQGASVGILDADIYGPSQPTLLGGEEKPELTEDKKMRPIMRHGLQSMSIGYLLQGQDAPLVWRGPMVSSALQQLLFETAWEDLDYLIIDLPPGTGDIQLTLAQKIPVAGVVIVTTPQEIALLDARKALMMFNKLSISVLGVIENMSIHVCKTCGQEEAIFGEQGGSKLALEFGVSFLGKLPLDSKIRVHSDNGMPPAILEPEGTIAQYYLEIATQMLIQLSLQERDYRAVFPPMVLQDT
jgi:ATP-binding protein involved in chromosome partitioning